MRRNDGGIALSTDSNCLLRGSSVIMRNGNQGVFAGKKFNKFMALGKPFKIPDFPPTAKCRKRWLVVVACECGAIRIVNCGDLSQGRTRQCRQCVREEGRNYGNPIYCLWLTMKKRCASKKQRMAKVYRNRGISVCREWVDDYEAFRNWCAAAGWAKGLLLDRIDNYSGYSPDNCRFVDRLGSANNMRSNVYFEAFGESKTASAWTRDSRCGGIGRQGIVYRIIDCGWPAEKAITTPSTKAKSKPPK